MRLRVASLTYLRPASALVTVVVPTPASLATSDIVVTRSRARSPAAVPGAGETPLPARRSPGATSFPTPPRRSRHSRARSIALARLWYVSPLSPAAAAPIRPQSGVRPDYHTCAPI